MFVPPAPTLSGVTGKSRVLCLQKGIGILRSYFRVSYGGRSSMVEPQIVVLVVAGSSPVGHPWNFGFSSADFRFADRRSTAASSRKSVIENPAVPVAQPDRASDFGS